MKRLTPEEAHRLGRLRLLHEQVVAELARLEQRVNEPAKTRRTVAECGTDSGYYRHLRTIGEPACDDCKRAHREAERDRARRAREEAA